MQPACSLPSSAARLRPRLAPRAPLRLLNSAKRLVVYTKPECPLCDGLKDKVAALLARAQFMPCVLTEYTLEVRDISLNDEWLAAFAYEVPVLVAEEDGKEAIVLPRPLPRITADRLQKHIEAHLLPGEQT